MESLANKIEDLLDRVMPSLLGVTFAVILVSASVSAAVGAFRFVFC